MKQPAIRSAAFFLLATCLCACIRTNSTIPPDPSSLAPPGRLLKTADLSPTPPFIDQAHPQSTGEQENAIQLMFFLPVEGPFQVGSQADALIYSDPVIISRLTGEAGEFLGMSILPWEVNPFELEEEMCIAWDKPCPLEGNWRVHNERLVLHREVEWGGTRLLWVTVRYRDSSRRPVPVYISGVDPVEIAQVSVEIEGVWDRSTPIEALLPPVQTAVAQTQSAYPLAGSVLWEEGRCCAGGTAGQTILVQAGFSASSPHGEVSEMRVRTGGRCFLEEELAATAWEPFVSEKSYPFTLTINWVGYYISVQYRDPVGNLSPVTCDDISLEGMPPRTP